MKMMKMFMPKRIFSRGFMNPARWQSCRLEAGESNEAIYGISGAIQAEETAELLFMLVPESKKKESQEKYFPGKIIFDIS